MITLCGETYEWVECIKLPPHRFWESNERKLVCPVCWERLQALLPLAERAVWRRDNVPREPVEQWAARLAEEAASFDD